MTLVKDYLGPADGGACVRFTLPSGGEPPRIEPELADPAGVGS